MSLNINFLFPKDELAKEIDCRYKDFNSITSKLQNNIKFIILLILVLKIKDKSSKADILENVLLKLTKEVEHLTNDEKNYIFLLLIDLFFYYYCNFQKLKDQSIWLYFDILSMNEKNNYVIFRQLWFDFISSYYSNINTLINEYEEFGLLEAKIFSENSVHLLMHILYVDLERFNKNDSDSLPLLIFLFWLTIVNKNNLLLNFDFIFKKQIKKPINDLKRWSKDFLEHIYTHNNNFLQKKDVSFLIFNRVIDFIQWSKYFQDNKTKDLALLFLLQLILAKKFNINTNYSFTLECIIELDYNLYFFNNKKLWFMIVKDLDNNIIKYFYSIYLSVLNEDINKFDLLADFIPYINSIDSKFNYNPNQYKMCFDEFFRYWKRNIIIFNENSTKNPSVVVDYQKELTKNEIKNFINIINFMSFLKQYFEENDYIINFNEIFNSNKIKFFTLDLIEIFGFKALRLACEKGLRETFIEIYKDLDYIEEKELTFFLKDLIDFILNHNLC